MKLLIVSESPLYKIGPDYFAIDPWIRIPRFFADHGDTITLWSPVACHSDDTGRPNGSWHVDTGNMRIEHHDHYSRFVDYYRLFPWRFFSWRAKADRLIREHDVVLMRAPSPMTPLIVSSVRRQKKPFVLMLLLNLITQSDRLLTSRGAKKFAYQLIFQFFIHKEKKAAKRADKVYVYSRELAERHGTGNGRIQITQDPHLRDSDIVHRDDTCISGGEIHLLRVCWLIPSKGVEHLLDAVALLIQRGRYVRLEIVGQERTAGYRKTLEDRAKKLGIADRITFSGWVPFDRIGEVYLRNDIQILSSLGEGTPRCIVEGFARGLPLICTSVGGCQDTLVDKKDALMIPAADPRAIADAVELLIDDGDLRRKLIEQGLKTARTVTFEKLGIQLLNEIRVVAQKRNPETL